jgi:hypothetical protein
LNLLPVAEAFIAEHGVFFNGLFYTHKAVTQEQQTPKVNLRAPRRVTIAYNPQKVDQIYLKLSDEKRIEKCQLAPQSEAFQGLSWYEVHDSKILLLSRIYGVMF